MCGWGEGALKNQNFPFQLDELLEVVSSRFDYKINSGRCIHRADFESVHAHLLLPTTVLFKWPDWKCSDFLTKEAEFWNFPFSSRGSSIRYLFSVITAISVWFSKGLGKAQWWWPSWMSHASAFFFAAAVKSS